MIKNENIKYCSLNFPRNGILSSGILGVTGWSMAKIANSGAGGVTSKTIFKNERKGHSTPIIYAYENGLINAVGLSGTGVVNLNNELKIVRKNSDAVIIASVSGGTIKDFCETIELLDNKNLDIIELNISCPNVQDEFGLPFASSPDIVGKLIKEVRKIIKNKLLVKLSPNFQNICDTAKVCEYEGADGITAINTVGPGMLIDINTFKPKLSNKKGGISGPAILPIAIRCVYDIYNSVKIPIIGMGGITKLEDALQIIIAGATLYGVGTGILYEGLNIFNKINKGIEKYLEEKKINYSELIGIAHKQ